MLLLLADALLIVLLAAAPLMYASVTLFTLIILSFLALILFNLVFFARPWALKAAFSSPFAWLGAGMLLFSLFQILPLPADLIQGISPAACQFFTEYFLPSFTPSGSLTVSVAAAHTIRALIQFLTYGLVFMAVLMRLQPSEDTPEAHPVSLQKDQYLKLGCCMGIVALLSHSIYDFNLHNPANGVYFSLLLALGAGVSAKAYDHVFFRRTVETVILLGFVIALFAIVQQFSFNGRIYWIGMKASHPVGPYVNYDHYAGFMELCAAVAVSMVVASIFHTSFFHCKGFVKKILWFSGEEANKALRYFFMSAVMVATIFMSTSRGGIMSFVLSQLLFFILVMSAAWRSRKGVRFVAVLASVVMMVSVVVVWLGPEAFLKRFHLINFHNIVKMEGPIGVRLFFYNDTLDVIRDFPVAGTGLGTFGVNFSRYRTFDYTENYLRHTHNDYLELVSETGAVGIIFLLGFLVFFTGALVRVVRKIE